MKPRVSILMLSFNSEATLEAAIDSVLRQTYRDFEIVAVDDGSRDRSLEIWRRFEARYPETIRVFTHESHQNRGIIESYQLALSQARGEVMAFLEGDDLWEGRNLEKKVTVLDRHPGVGVVYADHRPFGAWGGSLYWKLCGFSKKIGTPAERPFSLFHSLLSRNPVASFSHFVVRRNLFEKVPVPHSFQSCYDWWVLAHVSLESDFYFIPEKLTSWRIHQHSRNYGRVRARHLLLLHRFLEILYQSLARHCPAGEKQTALLRAIRIQEMIHQRKITEMIGAAVLNPVGTLRLLSYILLKNLLFSLG